MTPVTQSNHAEIITLLLFLPLSIYVASMTYESSNNMLRPNIRDWYAVRHHAQADVISGYGAITGYHPFFTKPKCYGTTVPCGVEGQSDAYLIGS